MEREDVSYPQLDQLNQNLDKRIQYLSALEIDVKPVQKNQEKDQLIVITIRTLDSHHAAAINIRKLSELDSLVQHINRDYGGHLIPFISSDLYFQQNLDLKSLTPTIQEYLNDLRTHPICQQDLKFFEFILHQKINFPQQVAYQKLLINAAELSRKYLNNFFARKEVSKNLTSLKQFNSLYEEVIEFKNDFTPLQEICENYLRQHDTYQQLMANFCQMGGSFGKGMHPNDKDAYSIRQKIHKMEKYIGQVEQAYNRVSNLNQAVRQLKGNIYKGLHEYQKQLEQYQSLLAKWSKSLSSQFSFFLKQATQVSQSLAIKIVELRKSQINEMNSYMSNGKKQQL